MKRTQVYLTDEIYNKIMSLADTQNKPAAQIIRIALDKGLLTLTQTGNDLSELSKLKIHGGPKNLSKKIDEYLYK